MIDNSTAKSAIETNPLERIRESNLPLYRFLMKYSPSSRSTMLRYLAMIVDSVTPGEKPAKRSSAEVRHVVFEFPWSTLNYDAALKVKGSIEARSYSPSTQSTLLVCLRGIAAELWDLGILEDKPWQQIRKLKAKSGSRRKKSRYIPLEDLSRMLATCFDGTRLGKRDACLLAILYGAGLRRTEAAKLKIYQIDRSAGSIRVIGKGDSERIVYLVDGVLPLIEDWLAVWNPVQDELFPAFLPHGDEPIPGESFSDQAIYKTVRKRALLAGVEVPSPHWFRHSFVTNSLRVSDVFIVARQVGHRQVETTRRYDDRPESEQAEAAKKWSIAKVFN